MTDAVAVAAGETVTGITNAIAVGAGGQVATGHVCAILSGGTIECWGAHFNDQLFDPLPIPIIGTSNAIAIVAGSVNSCALLASGSVQCWGSGALGDGTNTGSLVPVTVSGF